MFIWVLDTALFECQARQFSRGTTHKVMKMTFFVIHSKESRTTTRLETRVGPFCFNKLKSHLISSLWIEAYELSKGDYGHAPGWVINMQQNLLKCLGSCFIYVRVEWTKEMGYSNKEEIV